MIAKQGISIQDKVLELEKKFKGLNLIPDHSSENEQIPHYYQTFYKKNHIAFCREVGVEFVENFDELVKLPEKEKIALKEGLEKLYRRYLY